MESLGKEVSSPKDDDDDDVITSNIQPQEEVQVVQTFQNDDFDRDSDISSDNDDSAFLMPNSQSDNEQNLHDDMYDIDDDSSSVDDIEPLEYDEEDEIMQVVVDEHGTGNVIDHYNTALIPSEDEYDEDAGDDILNPMEDQSLKTEAEIGSEIFETSPAKSLNPIYENEEEEKSLKTSLRRISDQFINVTMLLGQNLEYNYPQIDLSKDEIGREKPELDSDTIRSLHVDREIKHINKKYVALTNNLGRSSSEATLSHSAIEKASRKSKLSRSVSKEMASSDRTFGRESSLHDSHSRKSRRRSSLQEHSKSESREVVEPLNSSGSKHLNSALGRIGFKFSEFTKRLGRSFSTDSLMKSSRRNSTKSFQQKEQRSVSHESIAHSKKSHSSIISKHQESDFRKSSVDSEKQKSTKESLPPSLASEKSKSLSNLPKYNTFEEIIATPTIRNSLQKITEDFLFVNKCLGDVPNERNGNTSLVKTHSIDSVGKDQVIESPSGKIDPDSDDSISPGEVSESNVPQSVIEKVPVKKGNMDKNASLESEIHVDEMPSPGEVKPIEGGIQEAGKEILDTDDIDKTSARTPSLKSDAQSKHDEILEPEIISKTSEEIINATSRDNEKENRDFEDDTSSKISENQREELENTSQKTQRTHSLIRAILKKEESIEVSKLLIDAHGDDLKKEEIIKSQMTFKDSLKKITNDILKVTGYLGTDQDKESNEEDSNLQQNLHKRQEHDDSEEKDYILKDLERSLADKADVESLKSINIKLEIKKVTDDIIKITNIMGDMQKEEIIKIRPDDDDVYMKGGIDAMSCTTMEASPTR